jgi:hypothetical protein
MDGLPRGVKPRGKRLQHLYFSELLCRTNGFYALFEQNLRKVRENGGERPLCPTCPLVSRVAPRHEYDSVPGVWQAIHHLAEVLLLGDLYRAQR